MIPENVASLIIDYLNSLIMLLSSRLSLLSKDYNSSITNDVEAMGTAKH
jgi:hypothetical protein